MSGYFCELNTSFGIPLIKVYLNKRLKQGTVINPVILKPCQPEQLTVSVETGLKLAHKVSANKTASRPALFVSTAAPPETRSQRLIFHVLQQAASCWPTVPPIVLKVSHPAHKVIYSPLSVSLTHRADQFLYTVIGLGYW